MAVGDLVVGRKYTLSIFCQANEQESDNTLQFVVDSAAGPFPVTMQDVADAADIYFAPLYKPLLANVAAYRGVEVREQSWQLGPFGRTTFANASAGDGTGGPRMAPTQCCSILNLASSHRGLDSQGRIYLPFIATDDLDVDGRTTVGPGGYNGKRAALATAIKAGLTIISGADTATILFGHYNFTLGAFLRWEQSFGVPSIATQRRRGDYGRKQQAPV